MWGGPLRPDSPPQKTPEAVALGQGRGLADGEAELSTPPPPPARRVNYPSWSDSSSPPGTRAAAHSLINLINVISVGFGVGAHCSADGGHSAQSACHLVGVLCGFSKGCRRERAIVSRAPGRSLQHRELSARARGDPGQPLPASGAWLTVPPSFRRAGRREERLLSGHAGCFKDGGRRGMPSLDLYFAQRECVPYFLSK